MGITLEDGNNHQLTQNGHHIFSKAKAFSSRKWACLATESCFNAFFHSRNVEKNVTNEKPR
eukprot:m.8569 g.8569  ORF g.8569 m.8569 type:complete len:61 (+) comp3923_c0_seq1:356-538(+)